MLLKQLSEACGGPGAEKEIRDLLRELVAPHVDEIRTDAMGNLIACKNPGAAGPKVMLAAHMDEVALMIMAIDSSGMLKFRPVGGIDPRVLVAKSVVVGKDKIPGVIGAKPIHLQKQAEQKRPFDLQELAIDIGCTSKEEAEKVTTVGDYAYFTTAFEKLSDGRLKGKALDDRAGCALLVELLQGTCTGPVCGVFTVQEEVGLRGARTAAYAIEPDLAIVLEATTAADTPGAEDHKHATTVGAGPCLTFMDRSLIPDPKLVAHLSHLAAKQGVPLQLRRTTTGSTDGGAISLTRAGVPTAVIALPCRYIHSPVAIISEDDYAGLLRIMQAFLENPWESEVL